MSRLLFHQGAPVVHTAEAANSGRHGHPGGFPTVERDGEMRHQERDLFQRFTRRARVENRAIFEIDRQVIRQLFGLQVEADFLVLRQQVDHGLAAITRVAMHLLEQIERGAATAVEGVNELGLQVHQIGGGHMLDEATQRFTRSRLDGLKCAQHGGEIAQMRLHRLARVVEQQGQGA